MKCVLQKMNLSCACETQKHPKVFSKISRQNSHMYEIAISLIQEHKIINKQDRYRLMYIALQPILAKVWKYLK